MSAPLWNSTEAMTFLKAESKHPSKNYLNLCAHLVARSAGYDGAGWADASTWGRNVRSFAIDGGKKKIGDVIFWVTNGWGHVARYAGNGMVLCNNSSGGVSLISIGYYSGLGTPFAVSGDDPRVFRGAFGTNPGRKPAAPKPATVPASLPVVHWAIVEKAVKADTEAKAISRVKAALAAEGFDCGNRTDHAGPGFRKAWKGWQARNGWKQTGIPGNRGLALLGARHGFRVTR